MILLKVLDRNGFHECRFTINLVYALDLVNLRREEVLA